jgi:hypothetical protein
MGVLLHLPARLGVLLIVVIGLAVSTTVRTRIPLSREAARGARARKLLGVGPYGAQPQPAVGQFYGQPQPQPYAQQPPYWAAPAPSPRQPQPPASGGWTVTPE